MPDESTESTDTESMLSAKMDAMQLSLDRIAAAPIYNGGLTELKTIISRLEERSAIEHDTEIERYKETGLWRFRIDKKIDGLGDRVTVIEAVSNVTDKSGRSAALKIFLDKWWIVVIFVIAVMAAAVGIGYPEISDLLHIL